MIGSISGGGAIVQSRLLPWLAALPTVHNSAANSAEEVTDGLTVQD